MTRCLTMKGIFESAGGSVTGRNHIKAGKNNQDAYDIFSDDRCTLAVVCDGCGSCPHSEVGAKIGAKLWLTTLRQHLNQNSEINWPIIEQEMLQQLESIAKSLAISQTFADIIHNYFLFTTLGVIITPAQTTIFSLGDGVIAINEKLSIIPDFPNNAPPYLAYKLLNFQPLFNISLDFEIPTLDIQSILIGSDGVKDFLESADELLPGKTEKAGHISQFWQQDRYFNNPDLIRRRLSMSNREVIQPLWSNQTVKKQLGLLSDDTTIVSLRKKRFRP
ncbi:MAG: protein phosphatase 2C domain-containing protein [Trichodesmium sp.]